MRSLTQKLLLAFLLVSIANAGLAFLFSRILTTYAFNQLLLNDQRDGFMERAVTYYESHGSWAGADQFFRDLERANQPILAPPSNRQPQANNNRSGPPRPLFILVDNNARIVVGQAGFRVDEFVTERAIEKGTPLLVNRERVATVIDLGGTPTLTSREEEFRVWTEQALLLAGIVSMLAALGLGLWLTRPLSRPLRALIHASRQMAEGQLGQQVPVMSVDEVGQLTQAFNQMSADLAQANEARRQMTADIAHELRTPLSVISGYIESMRDGVLKVTPERLDVMYDEVRHLQGLVQDLRTLSLADAGTLTLNQEAVEPQQLLQRTAATYQQRAHAQDVQVVVDTDDTLPLVQVDPERMIQVLGNLVSNALRFTPVGGCIQLGARHKGKQVELSVVDNGAGMAPEHLPRIFDRFYQADSARSEEEYTTSGLGLAIAKSIVELHQGKISVTSILEQGTTFTIVLPASS